MIDAGPRRSDHGSTGRPGWLKRTWFADIAKRLGALIEDQLGSEVVYTRTDDTFGPRDPDPDC